MYNRYIPPPKPKAAQPPQRPPPRAYVPEPAPAPPPSPPPAPVQAQTSSWLQPYARRVDPATLKEPSRIVFGDDDADLAPPVASKTEETTESKKEVKIKEPKQKKRKREERDQEKLSAKLETPLGEQREPSEKQEVTTEDASEQKKKPKREKKKKAAPHETQDNDTSVRTRHKAVFENMEKALEKAQEDAMDIDKAEEEQEEEPVVEHGLEPLPQPAPVIFDESKLTYETLPPWLANPIRVSDSTRKSFEELGISPEAARVLETKGFKEAFAVQTAVLPLLLPQPDRQGDVVVAAPTGSGKTLSYVLPMIEDISKSKITRLRGIIVLPTRDLVQQVQLACEACAAAFAVHGGKRVKIATAMGHKVFKEEQAAIMAEEQSYDPEGYEKWKKKTTTLVNLEDSDSDDDHHNLDLNPTKPLPNHVVHHVSKVDVLICTPGRLVEHITKTRGFSLDYARWLVVDEADKLLAQDFQQWLDVVLQKLSIEKPHARAFPRSNKSGVRKVILSATMTRDLSLLNGLKLSRPRLVLLEGTKAGQQSLPPLLKESAIKIRDPSLKPLYLIDLLNSEHITAINKTLHATESVASQTSDSDSSSDSDSDDESGSESESESESEVDSDSDSSSNSDSSSESEDETPKKKTAKLKKLDTTVLIFTKSNEATLRLSRLLCLLAPELGPLIGTLTSSTKTIRRTRTLRFFAEGKLRILVASDLVSRGIDLENLEHVINYDLPMSETSYVHRVGRTARAGRAGHAWTLLEHSEARRFWRDFAGEGKGASTNILRSGQVERVRITGAARGSEDEKAPEFSEERMKAYEKALEQLKREATGDGEGRRVDVAMRGKQQ